MFDGDQMNTLSLKTVYMRKAYDIFDPRENMAISKNDGLFDSNFNLIKDQMICVHQFTTLKDKKHKMRVIQGPTKKLDKYKHRKKKLTEKKKSNEDRITLRIRRKK